MTDQSPSTPSPDPAATTRTVALCLLTWNEAEGCRRDLPRLTFDAFNSVYALDNGSTDGTDKLLEAAGVTVHRQTRAGYNGAVIEAFEKCDCDALVIFHPKGTIDPAETRQCARLLREGADLVVGSRLHRRGRNEEDAKFFRPRKWFVRGLALCAAVLWCRRGPIVWDVLHGFRGMRKDRFFAINPLPTGLTIDSEMVIRSYKKRYRVAEFPSREQARPAGETHFKAWPTGKKQLAYLVRELRRAA